MQQNPSGVSRRTGGAVSPGLLNELLRVLMRLLNGLLTQANDLADRGGERVKAQWDEQKGGEQVRSRLSDRKHEASQRLAPIETALRETAQQLRRQGQGQVAGYADRASDQVERASDYLRDTDVDEMVDQTRGFARRRPGLFLGGAATLGFLAARFLKSSSQGASAGQGPGGTTSGAALSHGAQEPAPTPRGIAEGPGRQAAPAGGQPLEDRYAQEAGRTEPPRGI